MVRWLGVGLFGLVVGQIAVGSNDDEFREEKVVDRVPVFTTPLLTKLVNEGESIRLPCFVDELEGFVLLWKRGETILSVGKQVIDPQETRARIVAEKEGNWLVINAAKLKDQGVYTCHISAVHLQDISHSVIIRTRPIIKSTNSEVTVMEGENARLSCSLRSGQPTPEITWTRRTDKGDVTLGSGPTLTVFNATRTSAGMYRCTADNGFPTNGTDVVELHILHKPYIDQSQRFVNSSPNETAVLSCTVDSQPLADVTWSFDRQPLPTPKYKTSRSDNVYSLMLDPSQNKLGEYTCDAKNNFGSDNKHIMLSNKVGPISFTSSQEQTSKSENTLEWMGASWEKVDTFILSITSKDGKGARVIEVQPKKSEGSLWFGEHKMSGLLPQTVYTATVQGVNKHGKGHPSEVFRFGGQGTNFNPTNKSSESSNKPNISVFPLILSLYVSLLALASL